MPTSPFPPWAALPPHIRLGVSACLLGQEVRFDGGHKRDELLLHTLGHHVEWVPVCPEVEVGLGVPRETLYLIGKAENPRLVVTKSGQDHTQVMQSWAHQRLEQLASLNLHGYILKKSSPSCGLFRVKVYDGHKVPARSGQGIFARELVTRLPLLPVEEEGRLHDPRLRENFIERIFAYHNWTRLVQVSATPRDLVAFHTAHKLTLMAHSPRAQTDVLFHLMGFLKKHLDRDDKAEVVGVIEDYCQGLVPLIVPITLLRHRLRRYPVPDWIHEQAYLNPYPKEILLRNHV